MAEPRPRHERLVSLLSDDVKRTLVLRLTQVEQQERERVAELLHDNLQQLLHGLQRHLQHLRDVEEYSGAKADLLEQVESTLQEATEVTHTLTSRLSPPLAKEEDLSVAIQWLSHRFEELHGLEVSTDIQQPLRIGNENLRLLLHGLVSELLFNVIKHAETKEAALTMTRQDDRVAVMVEDKGVGVDPAQLVEGRGLRKMRERVTMAGGTFLSHSALGQGMQVRAVLPVSEGS